MQVLSDTSNLLPQQPAKRPRLQPLQPDEATFAVVVERVGIRGLVLEHDAATAAPAQDAAASSEPPTMDDPRSTRRQLQADLAAPKAQAAFLDSLSEAVAADEQLLRRCLLPIRVVVAVNAATGDSLMRLLLNMLPLQLRLATMLLRKLPELSSAECEDDGADAGAGAAAGHQRQHASAASLSSLILGQLRWLEVVADAAVLTERVLEVLPVCPVPAQKQLLGILPEVVQPQDHGVAIEQLQALLEADVGFMAAVLECLSNMQLEAGMQAAVLESLALQLPAVEVDDLAALVRYLLSSAAPSNAERVLDALRASLHFASLADPRLAVDPRQKGVLHASRSPEVAVVRELVAALQGNRAAEKAALQQQARLTGAAAHGCFDLVILLALCARPGDSRKAAEACLRRKLLEGRVSISGWLSKALQGHQACYRSCQLWPALLGLAEAWSSSRDAPVAAAAVALYVQLFVAFEAPLERQEVLHALHARLGSGVATQQDAALQALSVLAGRHCALLREYSGHLSNILDHLEGFTNSQLQSVFNMFAALTARQPAQLAAAAASAAPAAGGGGGASSSRGAGSSSSRAAAAAAAAGGSGGSRLQDELAIMLAKALSQPHPGYKRIGVVGSLALLMREGSEHALLGDADGAAAEALMEGWVARAEAVFSQCASQPGVMAFLLDQWAELLEAQHQRQQQAAAAAAAGGGGGEAGGSSSSSAPRPHLPEPMLRWLWEKVDTLVVNGFTSPYPAALVSQLSQAGPPPLLQLEDPNLTAELWFNLDGFAAPVYVTIAELAASKDASKRAQLTWLPAGVRLYAAVGACLPGNMLSEIDGLLGAPLCLPARAMFADGRWDTLPLASKVSVLASLQHAVCWLREGLAVFGPCVSLQEALQQDATLLAGTEAGTQGVSMQGKLLMRVTQLRALEALLASLAASCPAASAQLPDLSCPLLLALARLHAQPLGAAAAAGSSKADAQPSVLARVRCLRTPAAQVLTACPPPDATLTMLLPAAHLAADLHSKLKHVVTRARRPAGLGLGGPGGGGPGAAAAAAAAGQPSSAAACGPVGVAFAGSLAGPSGPPCLEGVALAPFVEGVLQPLLPSLYQQLSTALTIIKRQAEQANPLAVLLHELPGHNAPGEEVLYRLPCVSAVLQAAPAALQLALSCLQTFTLLLGCSKELPPAVMHHALAALALLPGPAGTLDVAEAQSLVVSAFRAARRLSCIKAGTSTLQLELAVMSLLQGVVGLAPACHTAPASLAAMRTRLSKAAAGLLQESWAPADEAQEDDGFTWKGQTTAITQLLGVLVSHASDASEELAALLTGGLEALPDTVAAGQQLAPVGGWAALCGATFNSWYKVVFEQLLATWEQLGDAGLGALRAAAGEQEESTSGGGGAAAGAAAAAAAVAGRDTRGRPKKKAAALGVLTDGDGQPLWDEQQVGSLLVQMERCASVFNGLLALTKKHPSRSALLAAALRCGGGFLDAIVKRAPFWLAAIVHEREAFERVVKDVRKGTRIMQAICSEGKVRAGGSSVVARAPAAKRSLERYVCEMQGLLIAAGSTDTLQVGFIKHRAMDGQVCASQLFPEAEEEDEDDDDEEADEDDGE